MNNKKNKDKKAKPRFKNKFKNSFKNSFKNKSKNKSKNKFKFKNNFIKNLKINNKLNSFKRIYSSISNKIDDLAGFNDKVKNKKVNDKDIVVAKKNFNKKPNDKNIIHNKDNFDILANGLSKEEQKHEKYLKDFDRKFNKKITNEFNDDIFHMENMDKFEDENNYNIRDIPVRANDKLASKQKKQDEFKLKDLLKFNKDSIKSFKKSIIKNDETKTLFGAAVFGLIILVLLFSSYYFLFYEPFQQELTTAKSNKMNELNALFKGPLTLDDNVLILKSEIELSNSPEEVKAIDILRPATSSWRIYQNRQIDITKDNFNRVMITYESESSKDEGSKNIIINVPEAKNFITQNDGRVLANIEFQKPDTVAVPILISRLQAGAGLVSVGSIVDIYSLSENTPQNQNTESQEYDNAINTSEDNNSEEKNTETNSNNDFTSSNSTNNGFDTSNTNSKELKISKTPDISGATVLAIIRSKDSGSVKADNKKSLTNIKGDSTYFAEDSKSFSTDVEEMLRAAISGGYDESETTKILDSYGLKLAEYERKSNLGELQVEYLLLIEVPRNDVDYIINNMENLIITLPTDHAPNWIINELKQSYLNR